MPLERDGEAQYSCLAHVPFDEMWGVLARFDAAGALLQEEGGVEACVIENGREPTQVGAIRRLVWPTTDDSRAAEGPLMRERLDAYYDSPLKRYYTATLLPYDGCYEKRSPFPFAVEDLAITFTASPVTNQEKCFLEFYATYRVASRAEDEHLRDFLTGLFRKQLDAAFRRFPAHACDDALPDCLVRLSTDEACASYHGDIEKVVAMWRAAVAAERGILAKVSGLRQELADNHRVLDAHLRQARDESADLLARAEAAERARDELRAIVDAGANIPKGGMGDAAALYSSPHAADADHAEAEAAARWEAEQRRQEEVAAGAAAPAAHSGARKREPCGTPFAGSARTVGVCITDEQIKEQFEKLDVNGNGWLSRDELRKFYLSRDNYGVYESDDVIERTIEKFIKDGRVTLPEFSVLMLKIAQR